MVSQMPSKLPEEEEGNNKDEGELVSRRWILFCQKLHVYCMLTCTYNEIWHEIDNINSRAMPVLCAESVQLPTLSIKR